MAVSGIKLIVGLANPGADYARTRHNAGAWLIERLACLEGVSLRAEPRFFGSCGSWQSPAGECRLLIPSTYMNLSGQSIGALSRFFKIAPEAILIVHDELDLPPGQARFKQGGGHGGHNGLRDSIAHLGSANFWRLRIGIGHPGDKSQVANYVLSKASVEQQSAIDSSLDAALKQIPSFVAGHSAAAMQQLHSIK